MAKNEIRFVGNDNMRSSVKPCESALVPRVESTQRSPPATFMTRRYKLPQCPRSTWRMIQWDREPAVFGRIKCLDWTDWGPLKR